MPSSFYEHSTPPHSALRQSRSIDLLRNSSRSPTSPTPAPSRLLKRSKSTILVAPERKRSASVPVQQIEQTVSVSSMSSCSPQRAHSQPQTHRTKQNLVRKASALLKAPKGGSSRLARMSSTLGLRAFQDSKAQEQQSQPPPLPTRPTSPVFSSPALYPLSHLDTPLPDFPFPRQSSSSRESKASFSLSLTANISRKGTRGRCSSQTNSQISSEGSNSPVARSLWLPKVFTRRQRRQKEAKHMSNGSTPSLQVVQERRGELLINNLSY